MKDHINFLFQAEIIEKQRRNSIKNFHGIIKNQLKNKKNYWGSFWEERVKIIEFLFISQKKIKKITK